MAVQRRGTSVKLAVQQQARFKLSVMSVIAAAQTNH